MLYLAILVCTTVVLSPSPSKGFVNWDDDKNFYENPLVQNSTSIGAFFKNIPAIFSTPIIGNYNPLSNLSFALESAIFGLGKPFNCIWIIYYFTSFAHYLYLESP